MIAETLNSVKTRSPLQVFAIFAIGIILPSAFLSYLGLRSFQYEGALMQKQTEEQYATVANLMQKELHEQTAHWVSTLQTMAHQSAFQQMNVSEMIPIVLNNPAIENQPIENLFVFNEDGRMVAPWSAEADSGRDVDSAHAVDWGVWSEEIARLDHLEFVDKNIAEAIKGYSVLQGNRLSAFQQAELLKSMAGGYRKLHERRKAEAEYLKLAHNYEDLLDSSGYPTGILARQLLIALYEEDKAWDRVTDIRLDLMEGLLLRRWAVSASRQTSLLEQITAALRKMMSARGSAWPERQAHWQRLQNLQNHLEQLRPICETFEKQVWPDLSKRLRQHGWIEQGGILELAGPNPEKKVAIVAPILSPATERRRGLLVAVVNGNAFWPSFEHSLLDPTQTGGLRVAWDRPSTKLLPYKITPHGLWKASIERQVDSIDPPIHFRISESSSQEQTRLSHRRLWIYGGMVGLSFIVILVGLVLMRRAVKREIEVANLKADFVANVSHELRTPLTTISYIGERLSLGRYRTEEERKEFYGMLDKETHRLRDLIEDILDFSKMLAGKKLYKQDVLEVAPLVQEAYERFEGKAKARGFEVAIDLPSEDIAILGDRTALLQVILNLLDNALKYSGQSRHVDVNVKKTADRAIIAVRDYGIGIGELDKDKIFEKFYRVEQGLEKDMAGGVGLGLAMVKHTVEGHRGSIRVESRLGEGSIFYLDFPLYHSGGTHGAHPSR